MYVLCTIGQDGTTALMISIQNGHELIAELLITKVTDVNLQQALLNQIMVHHTRMRNTTDCLTGC